MRERDFERLYTEHAAALFSFFAYRTGSRGLAEDLVADTFERALRARRRFDPRRGSEKAWLYAIGLNLLRDHARREGVRERVGDQLAAERPEDPSARDLAAVETRETLMAALEQLAPEEREAIDLRFGADLKLREIAKLTGESMTTAEGRVYRALGKLRANLDESDLR